jgi:L-ascorbate metabolism protein UlaG (beta-lactamase superfamily)
MNISPPQELLAPGDDLCLLWLGNLSWLLRRAVDLDLDIDTRVQPSPTPTVELAQHLDIHLISHWHGDHFSSTTNALLAELSDCLFVLPADCVDKAHEIGIPNGRIHIARPDEPFGLPGGVSVRPHRAPARREELHRLSPRQLRLRVSIGDGR